MMKRENGIDRPFQFPERLWKRPIEFQNGKPRIRFAASNYNQQTPHRMFSDQTSPLDSEDDRGTLQDESEPERPDKSFADEPQVKVSAEEGNAKVTVQLASVSKENLSIHCAEDSITLSVRTSRGSWTKEVSLPFRVDPDTAKAVFRDGKLELIVRKHGRFNPPRPRLDWV